MLARDYYQLGGEKSILRRIGDGNGFPFRGSTTLRFIDETTLAVIEQDKGISFLYVHIDQKGKFIASKEKNTQRTGDRGTDMADTNEADTVSFLSVTATDVCKVPLSKNIAICDTTTKAINFVDENEWFQKKVMPKTFVGLSAVSCFSIGFEVLFVICDKIEQSVTICREGGQVLFSSFGDPGNTFQEPVSMSVYSGQADLSEGIPTPSWYVGECSADDLQAKIQNDAKPGSFLVAKDKDIQSPKTYNIVYVNSIWRREMGTIVENTDGTYLLASKDASLIQDSVSDIIKTWDMLIKVSSI